MAEADSRSEFSSKVTMRSKGEAPAGVGAVATQSFVDPSYGKLGLDLLRSGKDSKATLTALLQLSDELEAQTDGRYALELYADETLGDQAATIEQVQSGTIDFAVVAGSLLENFESDFSVVNLPYLYESPEHQMSVLNDPEVAGGLYDTLLDDNIQVLSAYHGGVRNVYSSVGPVETPSDLSGQKIRVIGSDTNVRMMELMGGVGSPMAQGEVYTAIQSGVLDGAENNELIYSALSHDEIAPYYSRTEHLMMPDYLVTSPTVWDGISEEDLAADDCSATVDRMRGRIRREV